GTTTAGVTRIGSIPVALRADRRSSRVSRPGIEASARQQDSRYRSLVSDRGEIVARAMVLDAPGLPLRLAEIDVPAPGPEQVRIAVKTCSLCRTDLHVVDGELTEPKLPIVPGHQIVGVVESVGEGAELQDGDRVGVPWLGWTCGACRFCLSDRE